VRIWFIIEDDCGCVNEDEDEDGEEDKDMVDNADYLDDEDEDEDGNENHGDAGELKICSKMLILDR
jgi:hypothetical protein